MNTIDLPIQFIAEAAIGGLPSPSPPCNKPGCSGRPQGVPPAVSPGSQPSLPANPNQPNVDHHPHHEGPHRHERPNGNEGSYWPGGLSNEVPQRPNVSPSGPQGNGQPGNWDSYAPSYPSYGPPGYGPSAYGPPAYGPPAYGPPAYGPPGYGGPGYGGPAYYQPQQPGYYGEEGQNSKPKPQKITNKPKFSYKFYS